MVYNYGSRPVDGYDYRCFVKHLAPVLPKDDKVFYYEGTLKWRSNINGIPLALFQNICHWKSPRRFDKVLENKAVEVNARWREALRELNQSSFSDKGIKRALGKLDKLDGVGIPIASALLTAWNPEQFGIMDFKTLAVLNMPQRDSLRSFIAFRAKLLELKDQPELKNCALRQIELALWHYYPIQNADQKKRPDN